MKHSLRHLPKLKQNEIQSIALTIRSNCKTVEKIILFGSYARGTYKEAKDLKPNRKSGHISDYDILVVTTKKEVALDSNLWGDISDQLKKLNLSAHTRIITHDIKALNNKLGEGQYFYSDIKKEGILIYDTRKSKLIRKRKLKEIERQRIAREYFNHWFESAEEFFVDYKNAFKRKSYKKSAFYLHQTAESAYKAILLVFTNYNPNEHFLAILSDDSEHFCPDLKLLLPHDTKSQRDRFKLLEYAYIGARYDPNYNISKEDLEILAKDVAKLLHLTKKICEEKIENFVKK